MEEKDVVREVKRIYNCYMQLEDFLPALSRRIEMGTQQASGVYCDGGISYAKNFNCILRIAKDALNIDDTFKEAVSGIEEVQEERSYTAMEDVLARGCNLRGLCRAFTKLYMAPKDKEKIGF